MNRHLYKNSRFVLATLLLLIVATAQSQAPPTGMWYPPNHSGHGFDLQKAGQQYTLLFYTYDQAGTPEWLYSVAQWADEELVGDIIQVQYNSAATPPIEVAATRGQYRIEFTGAAEHEKCLGIDAQYKALIHWTIDEEQDSWCIVPIMHQSNVRQEDFTGHYYSGPEDTGWGVTLDYQGVGEDKREIAVLYYYDAEGKPRWAIGFGQSSDGNTVMELNHVKGFCRGCEPEELEGTVIGEINHRLNFTDNLRSGQLDVTATYPGAVGGDWNRLAVPMQPLSENEPGMEPIPAIIENSSKTAVVDVTLVPMTDGFPTLTHQNILIENGIIVDINNRPSFQPAEGVTTIDGRGLFLAPGMSEMHLHITVGGQQAAEQAGLLMIASGVTTALNTGNNFQIDVPGLSTRFENGELIGPTFYTGQVAYGASDNGAASLTVSSPEEAVLYAERLKNDSFDFIKYYWGLTVPTLEQFRVKSEELGLPIIGHIPLTQPMNTTLLQGQKLAVHIQEPFASYMQYRRNTNLIPAAAQILLERGTYLSPTLAVFESYVMISDNQVDTYNEYINRDGNQYTPRAVKDVWQNYFNQPYIQSADRLDLLSLFSFYQTMTKSFFDAGVPMLTGTDATGFPGVMAGFGVHEELRLLHDTGIPIADVFAMTTRNAGFFIKDTLNETVQFGTIEAGKRADFILTEDNPLNSLDTIKRPFGVMARGRFWSQDYLTSQLDQLDLNFTVDKSASTSMEFCHHQDH